MNALVHISDGSELSATRIRERISAELRKARPNERRIAEIQQLLTIYQAVDGGYFRPVLRRINQGLARLRDAILDDATLPRIRQIVQSIEGQVEEGFSAQLNRGAQDKIDEEKARLQRSLSDSQFSAATGLNVIEGRTVPQPGPKPPRITDTSLSLTDILLIASPLLVIAGDIWLQSRLPIEDELEDIETEPIVEDMDREISRQYRDKIQRTFEAQSIAERITEAETEAEAVKVANEIFRGDGRRVGIIQNLRQEMRHEQLRVAGQVRETVFDELDDDLLVGCQLFSRFLDTTDPEHAANDGARFYKDNRGLDNGAKGVDVSFLRWRDRLIPPYRKNCVCFKVPIFDDPFTEQFGRFGRFSATFQRLSGARRIQSSDVGGRIWDNDRGGFRTITDADVGTIIRGRHDWDMIQPRDVGTFAEWFDEQLPFVQKKLMTESRWNAAQERRDAKPQYADFVDIEGKQITVRQIRAENRAQRELRTRSVRSQIRTRRRLHERSWEAGGNKWRIRPNDEERYRETLRSFLRLLTRN